MVAGALVAIVVAIWILYRVTSARSATGTISVDTGCQSDSTTAALMRAVVPGVEPIRCEPWDIGTGVTGYRWRAPEERAVVLVVTGWGDYAQRYATQASLLIPHLLQHGFTVHAFDMWGSGRSPGARGATHLGDAVRDHLAARHALRQAQLPVFLLGHSVGGLVTATSATNDPENLAGLILIAPSLDWGLGWPARLLARTGALLAPTVQVPGPGGADTVTRDPDAQHRLDEDPLMLHGSISWSTAGTGVAISQANWERYDTLRVPVLVVHGSDDRTPNPEGSRRFIGLVSSPDTTLHIIPGGLHALLDDTAGPDVVKLILTWLDERLPGPVPASVPTTGAPSGGHATQPGPPNQ